MLTMRAPASDSRSAEESVDHIGGSGADHSSLPINMRVLTDAAGGPSLVEFGPSDDVDNPAVRQPIGRDVSAVQLKQAIEKQRVLAAHTLAIHGEVKQVLDELVMESLLRDHPDGKRRSESIDVNKVASPRVDVDHRSPHATMAGAGSGGPSGASAMSVDKPIAARAEAPPVSVTGEVSSFNTPPIAAEAKKPTVVRPPPICSPLLPPIAATQCEHRDIRLGASPPPTEAQCPSPFSKTTTEEGDGPSKPEEASIESDSYTQSDDESPSNHIRLVERRVVGRRSPSETTEAAASPVRRPSAAPSSREDRNTDRSVDHRRRRPVRDLDPYRSLNEVKYVVHHNIWPNVNVHVPVKQVPEHLIIDPACSVASMN